MTNEEELICLLLACGVSLSSQNLAFFAHKKEQKINKLIESFAAVHGLSTSDTEELHADSKQNSSFKAVRLDKLTR